MREGKSREAGGYRGVCLQRLLIEARALAAARPKTVATDGREMTGLRGLRFQQPAQRVQACLEYSPREVQCPLRIIAWESLALS